MMEFSGEQAIEVVQEATARGGGEGVSAAIGDRSAAWPTPASREGPAWST